MKYMGSKARLSKKIIPLMKLDGRNYIEPFAGGMNMISEVESASKRTANDVNHYVVDMFKMLVEGWVPEYINREKYRDLKNLNGLSHEIGWAGVACSYSGKWFGGFAGITETRQGVRNYQEEALRNALKQADKLKGVIFSSLDYLDISIPSGSVVYCDPPYANTTGYKDKFDSEKFWEWVKFISKDNDVFVSEYSAPDFAREICRFNLKSSLSANGVSGCSIQSIERIFKVD